MVLFRPKITFLVLSLAVLSTGCHSATSLAKQAAKGAAKTAKTIGPKAGKSMGKGALYTLGGKVAADAYDAAKEPAGDGKPAGNGK